MSGVAIEARANGEQRSAKEQFQLVVQLGGALTAYTYFLGWGFFQSALTPFHVTPEEIGISPAWLAVRAIPLAYTIALIAAVFFGLGHVMFRSVDAARDVLGAALLVILLAIAAAAALAAYMGLSWVSEALFSRTFTGPRLSDVEPFVNRRGDEAELWFNLVISLIYMALPLGVAGLLAFDTTAREKIRRGATHAVGWARRRVAPKHDDQAPPPDDGSGPPAETEQPAARPAWWRGIAIGPLDSIESWTKDVDLRRTPLAIAIFVLIVTIVGWTSATLAGTALGEYVAKGHPATYNPLLDWPAVAVVPTADPDADPTCLIELGSAGDVYVLYSPETRKVERVSVENVVLVSSLDETCAEAAD